MLDLNSKNNNVIVSKIKKRENSEIWIQITKYKGTDRIDIREYYKNIDSSEFLPTKKGISLEYDTLPKIKDLLLNLADAGTIGKYGFFELHSNYSLHANQKMFNGHLYNEIRIYYYDKVSDEWKPTNKGITFSPKLTALIADALELE